MRLRCVATGIALVLLAGTPAAAGPSGGSLGAGRHAAVQSADGREIAGSGPAAIVGFAPGSAEVPPVGVRALSLFAARVRATGRPVVVLHEQDGSGTGLEMARVRQVRDLLMHLGVEVADSPPERAGGLVIVVTGTLGGH